MTKEEQEEKQNQLDAYKAKVEKMTLEELEAEETAVIAEADEVDKATAETMYDMPSENYKIVAAAIQKLLDKQTVQWQYTLGLVTLYEFWNPEVKAAQINHPTLDATLRTLGEMQFKGYEEWAAVVAINKYFEPFHEAYVANTQKVYDVAAKHNMIIDEMNMKKPIGELKK